MTYLSAVQVKNLLVKEGISRGQKTGFTKDVTGGVDTIQLGDGWVWVRYANSTLAEKSKMDVASHNAEGMSVIHFILQDKNRFEVRTESLTPVGATQPTTQNYYRKAI